MGTHSYLITFYYPNGIGVSIKGMANAIYVNLTPEESGALQSRMRDLQSAVSRYYAATGSHADFEPELRAFITLTQAINDLLSQSISDTASYTAALDMHGGRTRTLLDGIKYVRNVDQHLLHSVVPDSENARFVGGTFGVRLFPVWKAIPVEVHDQLRRGTRALKPAFDGSFVGREISSTMMDILRLYGSLIPDAVHRDGKGEWSGFPLMSQPGLSFPLHPEEPLDRSEVHDWLSTRVPNGDVRVAMGLRIHNGVKYLYGNTWVGEYSFTPFVETTDQVRVDTAAGFTYLACPDMSSLRSANGEFPDALQGSVLRSTVNVANQGTPLTSPQLTEEWETPGTGVYWDDVNVEVKDIPSSWYLEIRRARRLNALVPPSYASR